MSQQQGHGYSREDVPLGLKATRVAHAAAVSSRFFSPSMRSSFSGQVQPSALPSQHELDDTLGFVQRQGSFHSEHAVQHLMTDQPHPQLSSRPLAKHTSLLSQRSLHQRDSVDSRQRQSSMPRQSFQTDASDHQSQHSHVSPPRSYSNSRHSQHGQGGYSQRPPLDNSQIIAHSALFQAIPVSPRNVSIPTDYYEHTDYGPHGLPSTAVATQHSFQDHPPTDQCNQQSGDLPSARAPAPGTAVDSYDSYHPGRGRQQDYQPDLGYQSSSSAAGPAAVGTPLAAFQSADTFSSEMLSSDNNQTEQWDNSMLQRIQEGSEVTTAAAFQQDASPQSKVPDGALQSADSFASNVLSTDMTRTAHWGKRMLSELEQEAEEGRQQEGQTHQEATSAMHAVLDSSLEAEGMHPPIDKAEAGPHDWLWLPDELSTINDSDLSSIDGGRPDIETWLAQQQASRLASTAQNGTSSSRRGGRLQQASRLAQHAQQGSRSFKTGGGLQQAVSPNSPLNTADSLDSTYDAACRQAGDLPPKAHSSLPWAQNSTPVTSYSLQPVTTSHTVASSYGQAPAPMPPIFPPQSPGYSSPFARWSSTPIFGASAQPDQTAVSTFDPPHQQPQQQQQQQQQQQTVHHQQSGMLHNRMYNPAEACAKQRELDSRLAALDTLEFPGEADMFKGFGSPLQTRQMQAQADLSASQLYNTEAPLPVDAPGATLSAPEEALLASMREMLHGELHTYACYHFCCIVLHFFLCLPCLYVCGFSLCVSGCVCMLVSSVLQMEIA